MDCDIISAVFKYKMLYCGDKVLVAVSGGPDSITMLHSLNSHKDELGISLHIAHVNHCLRGEKSDDDEQFVINLAKSLDIPITIKKIDVNKIKSELKLSVEEAARKVRYEFLQEIAKIVGADKIAVGHNANDRAETVLFNIIRGSGISGISSIKPVRDNIIRPLIDTSREQILEYIKEFQLPYRVDESNDQLTYTRNKIRHTLLPAIISDFNPNAISSLNRLADIAELQSSFMNLSSAQALSKVIYAGKIDVGLFKNLPDALQYEVIRLLINKHKGDLIDIEFEQIARIVSALHDDEDFNITLTTGNLYAKRKGDSFNITHKPDIKQDYEIKLNIPGATHIPGLNVCIEAESIGKVSNLKVPEDQIYIDLSKVKGQLKARNIKPGDRITPFGMINSKKIQDVLVDKKVPRYKRSKLIAIADEEKIIWLSGVVTSNDIKINQNTKDIIHLKLTNQAAHL